jgi:hypothetical protein
MSAVKAKKKEPLSEDELTSWKLLRDFRALLADFPATLPEDTPDTTRRGGPKRLLAEEDYLCAFLFAQFNPILDSMRGLCAASKFEKVQTQVCTRRMSLGSFSEAQSVFGFGRLEDIFKNLAAENIREARPGSKIPPDLLRALRLVDSSVFLALPRMSWAHWRSGIQKDAAVRLHLSYNLLDEKPSQVVISPAKLCERKALEMMLKEGEIYVGDRNYGRDYQLLDRMEKAGCGYIMRLCEQASITVLEELPLSAEDRKAGVVSDQIVSLGADRRSRLERVRIVRIEKPELDEPLLIVTNQLSRDDLSAALVGEIYWNRWAIELFFRWLKCIFGNPKQWHWFAESPEGVGIQLYSALIASLLLARRMGKLPNKRMIEALHWHQLGLISEEELSESLQKALPKKSR